MQGLEAAHARVGKSLQVCISSVVSCSRFSLAAYLRCGAHVHVLVLCVQLRFRANVHVSLLHVYLRYRADVHVSVLHVYLRCRADLHASVLHVYRRCRADSHVNQKTLLSISPSHSPIPTNTLTH